MSKKIFILIVLSMLLINQAIGQRVATVNPSIFIIPYTNEDQNPMDVLNNDAIMRSTITELNSIFTQLGNKPIGLKGKLNNVRRNDIFQQGTTATSDEKKQFIDRQGGEICVEVEQQIHTSDKGNRVVIILNATDATTGTVLSSKTADSGIYYADVDQLVKRAIKKAAPGFLQDLQDKFDQMLADGRSIVVQFAFSEDSQYNMSTDMGNGNLLGDVISDWMEDNAYKNYCHSEGMTDSGITFDDVHIPVRNDDGTNYKIKDFTRKIRNYIQSLGLNCKQDIIGMTAYITIQ